MFVIIRKNILFVLQSEKELKSLSGQIEGAIHGLKRLKETARMGNTCLRALQEKQREEKLTGKRKLRMISG